MSPTVPTEELQPFRPPAGEGVRDRGVSDILEVSR